MVFKTNIAQKTTESLLQINAIKLQPNKPFIWASGWKSPIYCDNRVVLSYPSVRDQIRKTLANCITSHFGTPNVIAGVATGGIGIGVLVADYLNLPFVYVRPEAKKHGRQNQIEGYIDTNQTVVVIEDLISTGKSSLNAVNALEKAKANVIGMAAIFSYGFDTAYKNFEASGIEMRSLSDYDNLLAMALQTNYITSKQQSILAKWNANPSKWGF